MYPYSFILILVAKNVETKPWYTFLKNNCILVEKVNQILQKAKMPFGSHVIILCWDCSIMIVVIWIMVVDP